MRKITSIVLLAVRTVLSARCGRMRSDAVRIGRMR